nr:hypothetical protein [Morchella crassipes]
MVVAIRYLMKIRFKWYYSLRRLWFGISLCGPPLAFALHADLAPRFYPPPPHTQVSILLTPPSPPATPPTQGPLPPFSIFVERGGGFCIPWRSQGKGVGGDAVGAPLPPPLHPPPFQKRGSRGMQGGNGGKGGAPTAESCAAASPPPPPWFFCKGRGQPAALAARRPPRLLR